MAHPLINTALIATAMLVAASPSATAQRAPSRATTQPAKAHAAIVGETVVIGSDGADMREIAREADGLFYVHAIVNGARVRFLVDTGANYIMLSAADAARLGLSANRRYDSAVETAGGRAAMAWTTLDEMQVAGRTLTGLRAAIVRNGLGVSLLGQNMLSKLDLVTIEGDRLRMR